MDSTPDVHRHSGRLGGALFLVPLGTIPAALVLAVVYSYIVVYSPVAGYISLLFVAGFGFGLAMSISTIGYVAKCRSPVFLRIAGFGAGILALYASWAVFTYALLSRFDEGFSAGLLDVVLSPAGIWEFAKTINAEGWYTVAGMTPSGMFLGTLWAIEAVIVVGAPTLCATAAIDGQVFCERCGKWCSCASNAARLSAPEDETTLAALRPDNLGSLQSLRTVGEQENPYLRLDTWECPECHLTAALQAKLAARVENEKGQVEEKAEDLTPIWTIPASALQKVQELGARPPVGLSAEESR